MSTKTELTTNSEVYHELNDCLPNAFFLTIFNINKDAGRTSHLTLQLLSQHSACSGFVVYFISSLLRFCVYLLLIKGSYSISASGACNIHGFSSDSASTNSHLALSDVFLFEILRICGFLLRKCVYLCFIRPGAFQLLLICVRLLPN